MINLKITKEEVAPGIIIYSNVILDSENLYADIEDGMVSAKLKWTSAKVTSDGEIRTNYSKRDTSQMIIPYQSEFKEIPVDAEKYKSFAINLSNLFLKSFDVIEKDYMNTYGVGLEWHDVYYVLKYGVGQQFTNHIDDSSSDHRRVSTAYYLNDNYLGGEINFPRFNITIKPKANQMIVFPSTYVYNHSVSPVTDGTRYAVVSWLK